MTNKSTNDNKDNQNQTPKKMPGVWSYILLGFSLLIFLNVLFPSAGTNEITYNEFLQLVEEKKVEEVKIGSETIDIKLIAEGEEEPEYKSTGYLYNDELINFLRENNVKFSKTILRDNYLVDLLLTWVLPFGLMFFLMSFVMRKVTRGGSGGIMGLGKSNAKVYVENEIGITFKDVAGQDEAKEQLKEIIDFLEKPEKYTEIGAKLPKGALLVGPPGTGKTLIAKAVAGEAKVPFFSISGSNFVEMYAGMGAAKVRDLFKEAEKLAPCIIFIDEIDSIGKSRDNQFNSNDEREQTLNQLLTQMDGFDANKGIVI